MLKFYSVLKDIENRGGGFIRERKVGQTPSGEIYTGTVYYNDGDHAEIKVMVYPHGGSKILDRANSSKECTEEFIRLLSYLDKLERTPDYRRTLIRRAIMQGATQIFKLYLVCQLILNVVKYLPTLELPKLIVLALNMLLIFMTEMVKDLIVSEY